MKIKDILSKISNVLRVIFGYGITVSLFAGGLTFFGFIAALIIGGETATLICTFISSEIIPVIIYISTVMVVLGLIAMYLNGEVALTSNKKKSVKHEGEM